MAKPRADETDVQEAEEFLFAFTDLHAPSRLERAKQLARSMGTPDRGPPEVNVAFYDAQRSNFLIVEWLVRA